MPSRPLPAAFGPRRSTVRAPWSAAEARQVLDHALHSGLTLSAYARRHGLCVRQLYWWRDRVARASPPAVSQPATQLAFVPVVAVAPAPSRGSGVEVVVGDLVVRIERGFCAETLSRAVSALAGGARC